MLRKIFIVAVSLIITLCIVTNLESKPQVVKSYNEMTLYGNPHDLIKVIPTSINQTDDNTYIPRQHKIHAFQLCERPTPIKKMIEWFKNLIKHDKKANA